MAKKIQTPEEYKAKIEKKKAKRKHFMQMFLKTLAFALAIAMTYSASTIAYTRIASLTYEPTTTPVEADNSEQIEKEYKEIFGGDQDEDPSNPDGSDDKTDGSNGGNLTDAQAEANRNYELFVNGFKGVKTNAKSATLVKKNAYNYENHVKANAVIEAAAAPLLSSLLKEEDVNETYTGADINAKFPPAGATCGLTKKDITKISCTEEGNYYIIEIIVRGSKNPNPGQGVGSVASIISKQSIQDPIKGIPAINSLEPTCDYKDTTVKAKIEKSSGKCVEYYCHLPMILIMSNDKNSYEIGLAFEEWWTIAY